MKHALMGNSAVPQYMKLCAVGILAVTYLDALAYATFALFSGRDALSPMVSFVLGSGLSFALSLIGAHQGASLAETTPGGSA